jgi:hypothetical protein
MKESGVGSRIFLEGRRQLVAVAFRKLVSAEIHDGERLVVILDVLEQRRL